MKLHKLRFIELLRNEQNKMDAIKYARTYFPQFVSGHEREIQALMGALMFAGTSQCTMNIFGSKSGHLNNSKNCKVFFIFPKFLLYLIIFPSSAAYLALSTL